LKGGVFYRLSQYGIRLAFAKSLFQFLFGEDKLRNPVIATTQSAGSRPVIPNDGDRKFRTMATTPRSEATLVY
jgi:hypothetical protein